MGFKCILKKKREVKGFKVFNICVKKERTNTLLDRLGFIVLMPNRGLKFVFLDYSLFKTWLVKGLIVPKNHFL